MCERAGLHVDAVVTDGARWNHMWNEFGVGDDSASTTHPCDDERKLCFFSDWCHLLKCMRNLLSPEPPRKKENKGTGDGKKEKRKINSQGDTNQTANKEAEHVKFAELNTHDPKTYVQKSLQV